MITRSKVLALLVVAITAIAVPAAAQQSRQEILNSLHPRLGTIGLGDGLAEIAQTDKFFFFDNADTQSFLTKVWGNPPGAGKTSLGMILPSDTNPLSREGWVVVVSYDELGYVSDEEAEKIDYDALMKEMQEATAEVSKRRVDQGQPSIELLGWARKPYYDAAAKKLYWAKRLRFGGSPYETLNYEIRILGRHGVLKLNVVASMRALAAIDERAQTILSMVHFKSGNTYAEYKPDTDQAAAYGLAGLIAGGLLAKVGFFKGLIALVLAFKKLILIALFGGLAGAWAWVRRAFGGKAAAEPAAASTDPPAASPGASA